MSMLDRLFGRQEEEEEPAVDPESIEEPELVSDYLRRGWAYHAREDNDAAVEDFRTALDMDPKSVDAAYGLGIALKAGGQKEQAVEAFQKAANLLEEGAVEDHDRSEMLHRLSIGQINELTKGDWDLEAEIWQRRK